MMLWTLILIAHIGYGTAAVVVPGFLTQAECQDTGKYLALQENTAFYEYTCRKVHT